jgi:hypothetical protein
MSSNEPPSEKSTKTLVDHAKSIAAIPGEKLAELRTFGEEQVDKTMAGFRRALPALSQAGYRMHEFEIELGITPKIIAHFMPSDASEEQIAAAREALKDNPIGSSMLSVLKRAGDAHKRFKLLGFNCGHIEIDVGVIPAVRLRYRAEDVA